MAKVNRLDADITPDAMDCNLEADMKKIRKDVSEMSGSYPKLSTNRHDTENAPSMGALLTCF